MADVMFPGMEGLASMEFMSPMAFQQAQQQIGLAKQFAQQNLQQKQADYTAAILKNLFDAQNNPLLLQNNQLRNEGLGYKNAEAQIDARKRAKLELWETEAQKEDYASKVSADKLKARMSDLEQDLVSMDPEVRARATALYQNTAGMLKLKETNDARVAAADARASSAERIAGMRTDSAERIAEANNAIKKEQIQARALNNKKPNENFQQAATRALREAYEATDPATRAAKMEESQYWLQQQQNDQLTRNTGKVDIGATAGVATQSAPNIRPGPAMPAPVAAAVNGNSGLAGGGANDTQNILLQEYAKVLQRNDGRAAADLAALQQELQRAGYRGPLPGQSQASGQAATPPAAPANNAPTAGTVYKGYRFKGGDPSKKENWIKE